MNHQSPTLRSGRALAAACVTLAAFHFAAAAPAPVAAQPAPHGAQAAAPAVFTKVGDTVISQQEYDAAFAQAARGKFYHGKPPEAEVAQLQREVAQNLVDAILLAREAERRKIKPDAAAVQKTIAGYDERYRDSAQWKANRPQVLPGLTSKLERDNVMEQLTQQVKTVAPPTPEQLERYYREHADKFTSPEQVRIRLILLKVDPSSPQAKWDGAKQEGAAILKRLRGGASFEEAAKLHSGDASASRGGEMGFIHRGMLPEPAQLALDAMKPGDISEPVVLLEGVALLQLEERKSPVLNPLDAVRERARDLYLRDQGEAAWTELLASLRRATPVRFDESRFLPLAASAEQAAPAR